MSTMPPNRGRLSSPEITVRFARCFRPTTPVNVTLDHPSSQPTTFIRLSADPVGPAAGRPRKPTTLAQSECTAEPRTGRSGAPSGDHDRYRWGWNDGRSGDQGPRQGNRTPWANNTRDQHRLPLRRRQDGLPGGEADGPAAPEPVNAWFMSATSLVSTTAQMSPVPEGAIGSAMSDASSPTNATGPNTVIQSAAATASHPKDDNSGEPVPGLRSRNRFRGPPTGGVAAPGVQVLGADSDVPQTPSGLTRSYRPYSPPQPPVWLSSTLWVCSAQGSVPSTGRLALGPATGLIRRFWRSLSGWNRVLVLLGGSVFLLCGLSMLLAGLHSTPVPVPVVDGASATSPTLAGHEPTTRPTPPPPLPSTAASTPAPKTGVAPSSARSQPVRHRVRSSIGQTETGQPHSYPAPTTDQGRAGEQAARDLMNSWFGFSPARGR